MNKKFLNMITEFIFVQHPPQKADIIMIPGSGSAQLAEAAAELWNKKYANWILPSGKFSILEEKFAGDHETEWEYLRDILIKNGVSKHCILKEDRAAYTYENAIFSRAVTDQAGMEIQEAIICCKAYHARRSLMYYQLLFPDTNFTVHPVKVSEITRENWHLSEKGIDFVLGELEKCGGQFHTILKDMIV